MYLWVIGESDKLLNVPVNKSSHMKKVCSNPFLNCNTFFFFLDLPPFFVNNMEYYNRVP